MSAKKTILLLSAAVLAGCSSPAGTTSAASVLNTSSMTETTTNPLTTSDVSTSSDTSTTSVDVPGNHYSVAQGNASFEDDGIVAAVDNTIAYFDNTLEKGTISASLKAASLGDNGLIFNIKRNGKTKFWETGVSYYFFFVSLSGTAYLGKVNNGQWEELAIKAIAGYDIANTYEVKVVFDSSASLEKTKIHCYINNAYQFSYSDSNKINGFEYGVRLGTKDTKISYISATNDYSEPQRDTIGNGYYSAYGKFLYDEDYSEYFCRETNSILYKEDEASNATFEVSLTQGGVNVRNCNGIIFGLDSNDQNTFWENGVSYYFFFIDESGCARLAKINYGVWTDLAIGSLVSTFNFSTWKGTNVLKVEKGSKIIKCYVDGVEYCTFVDDSPLIGNYYGLRAGSRGAKFNEMSVTKNQEDSYKSPTNYDVISGSFITLDDTSFISDKANSIALAKTETFTEGTISVRFNANSVNKTGLIFRSNEEATSYYAFVLFGNYCQLIKVVDGVTTSLSAQQFVTASHKNGSTEDMSVSIDGNTIRCSLRGIMYAIKTETLLEGTRYGFIANGTSALFGDISKIDTPTHKTAKTLVFGHSYMELWDNWQTDLNMFDDVYNIGIGGSVSAHWNNLEDEIVDYNPETGIFMIGINDLTGNAFTPEQIETNVRTLLTNLKTRCPNLTELALISCNRCIAREEYVDTIAQLNALYKQICQDYSWVHYANVDNAFLDGSGKPKASCFKDGLHPTSEAYQEIVTAICTALGK